MTRRIAVTGAPGSGKTSLLSSVAGPDIEVVDEAATEVNRQLLAAGYDRPEQRPEFLEQIVALQRRRRLAAHGSLQLHDRTVFCTVALARYLQLPEPAVLHTELADVRGRFETRVLFVSLLGFATPTPVRRISLDEANRFESIHRAVYEEFGFALIDIAPGTLGQRRAEVLAYLRASQ
jgi:predicted ATPase